MSNFFGQRLLRCRWVLVLLSVLSRIRCWTSLTFLEIWAFRMPLSDPWLDPWAFRMPDQPSRSSSFGFVASSFYFHLHHMKMSILYSNEFFHFFFIISDKPSPNHRWPGMGAIRSPRPSMGASWNVISISELHWSVSAGTFRSRFQAPSLSPQLRRNVALKDLQPFVEKKID